MALRRDTGRFLIADTIAGLEHAIEDDYRHHPVPREADPPGAADYLSPPEEYPGEEWSEDDSPELDGGGVPDVETRIILRELQMVFPLWTITYSGQMRAWIARTPEQTVCENSPMLLCMALALIERRQRQAKNSGGWHRPPWGTMSPP